MERAVLELGMRKKRQVSLSVGNLAELYPEPVQSSAPRSILKKRNGGQELGNPQSAKKRARFDSLELLRTTSTKSTPDLRVQDEESDDEEEAPTTPTPTGLTAAKSNPCIIATSRCDPSLKHSTSVPDLYIDPPRPELFRRYELPYNASPCKKSDKVLRFHNALRKHAQYTSMLTHARAAGATAFLEPARRPQLPFRTNKMTAIDRAVVKFLREYGYENVPTSILARTNTSDDFFKWVHFIYAQQYLTFNQVTDYLVRARSSQYNREVSVKFVVDTSLKIHMNHPLKRNDVLNPMAYCCKARTLTFLGHLVDFVIAEKKKPSGDRTFYYGRN